AAWSCFGIRSKIARISACSGASAVDVGVPLRREGRAACRAITAPTCRSMSARIEPAGDECVRVAAKRRARPVCRDAAVFDDVDVVCDRQRALDVLVDEQDRLGGVAGERLDQLIDVLAGAWIDAGGGLVDEIDRRLR